MNVFEQLKAIFTTPKFLTLLLKGMRVTLLISSAAALIGLVLGIAVALVQLAPKNKWTAVPKFAASFYVTVIRGTPMALQLFIMYFVVFAIRGFPAEVTAILAFGINSGAYVSENIRGGILSVDIGQTEAGRALGLSRGTTMAKIVIPQAIKNVLPSIGNELIALIKETSIVSMISLYDLTAAAKILAGGSYLANYAAPMIAAALFYLAIVYLLTFLIKLLEKRLRAGDKRSKAV